MYYQQKFFFYIYSSEVVFIRTYTNNDIFSKNSRTEEEPDSERFNARDALGGSNIGG